MAMTLINLARVALPHRVSGVMLSTALRAAPEATSTCAGAIENSWNNVIGFKRSPTIRARPQNMMFSVTAQEKDLKIPDNLVIHGLSRIVQEPDPLDEAALLRADTSEKVLPVVYMTSDFSNQSELPTDEEVTLDNRIFGVPIRRDIVHRVVVWQRANWRRGTGRAKTRAEVRGGGRKPWRQKGTGRARHGSIRSPLWRGGGKAHGPTKRDFTFKLNRKVRQMGLRCALAAKWREGNLFVVNTDGITSHYTRDFVDSLDDAGFRAEDGTIMLIDGEDVNPKLAMASRNLPWLRVYPQRGANVYAVVKNERLLVTQEALDLLADRLV